MFSREWPYFNLSLVHFNLIYIEILNKITENDIKNTHLCVFDELYSGTNPQEATDSATAYLKYINKFPNISFILTTHFLDLCKNLQQYDTIKNYNMETIEKNNDFTYTYKLLDGISYVKGAIKVLKDLNYPNEIINYFYN